MKPVPTRHSVGPKIVTIDGRDPVTASEPPFGVGAQGEVYQAEFNGKTLALKLYRENAGSAGQLAQLKFLAEKKAPSPHFVFPLQLVETTDGTRFGYLMDLLDPRFVSSDRVVKRSVSVSLEILVISAGQLCDAFLRLHASGLCYQDISFSNVFIDTATGDIRIIDNDNVGVNDTLGDAILGTPRFMAPEIVRGEAKPSAQSDRFSLAVLLFYLLFNGHPLEGQRESDMRCLDGPAMRKLYGIEPLYIFHPTDRANAPVAGLHDNPIIFRNMYPQVLMQAFERAFVAGMRPQDRVLESEWRKVMATMRDLLWHCESPDCGAEAFWDVGRTSPSICWSCHKAAAPNCLLQFHAGCAKAVVVEPGRRLFPHHLQHANFSFDRPIAEVTRNPKDPNLLGLRNDSEERWTIRKLDGTTVDVEPGKTAPLIVGNILNFGMVSASVERPKLFRHLASLSPT